MPLLGVPDEDGGVRRAPTLPKRYARTAVYSYLAYCERFGVEPWGGPDRWDAGQEALVREFLVVREAEEAAR